jgi:hypothetical protein
MIDSKQRLKSLMLTAAHPNKSLPILRRLADLRAQRQGISSTIARQLFLDRLGVVIQRGLDLFVLRIRIKFLELDSNNTYPILKMDSTKYDDPHLLSL